MSSVSVQFCADFLSFSETFRGRLKKKDIVEKMKDVESPPQH